MPDRMLYLPSLIGATMAQLFRPLESSYESMIRSSVLEVTRQVMTLTGLPDSTRLVYPGASEAIAVPGSTMNTPSAANPTQKGGKFTIEVIETLKETNILTTPVYFEDAVAVFLDKALDIVIKPVYTQIEIELKVDARFEDRTSAKQWAHDVRMHSSVLRAENMHEVTYGWHIPKVMLVILYQIYRCRESVAPYGETLKEWMDACLSPKVTAIVNQAGKNETITVSETNIGVIGWFDFTGQPDEPQHDKDTGTWTYTFGYKFAFDIPIGAHMRYPLMIHNRVLHEKFRPSKVPYTLRERYYTPGIVKVLLDSVAKRYNPFEMGQVLPGISHPKFDDWLPSQLPSVHTMLFRIMLAVNLAAPTEVLDLSDMGIGYEFDSDLIAYMRRYPQKLTQMGESFIHVHLYAHSLPLGQEFLSVDSDLSVSSSEALSARLPYHLVVSMVHDVSELSRAAREDLMENGVIALKYFAVLAPELPTMDIWPTLTQGGRITRIEFNRIMAYLDEIRSTHYRHVEYSARFVANCIIETRRKED